MRTSEQIRAEIEERFGFVPPFFDPALQNTQVLENLWQQTLNAYVNNPLPTIFKEKLFAYLSRYCNVPYCIVCHSCALRPLGMSPQEVLKLLESPTPSELDIERHLTILAAQPNLLTLLPGTNTALEESLFYCAVHIFLEEEHSQHCKTQLRRLLGNVNYHHLVTYLAYIKTCHLWVEANPEILYEVDQRVRVHLGSLLEQEPYLAEFFCNYREKVSRRQSRAVQLAQLAERKRNEEALRQSEARLRFFVEHTPAPVAMLDLNMRYLLASHRWLMDYGLGEQNIIGRSYYEVFPEISERWCEIHQHCLTGAVEKCEEDLFLRADGTTDWVRWEIHPWRNNNGEIGGIIIFAEVITKRKQAEEALKQAHNELEVRVEQRTAELRIVNEQLHSEIVERKKAEESLRESKERLSFLLRVAELGDWNLDLMSYTARRSLRHDQIFGYQSLLPEWTYKMFLEHVLPDERAEVDAKFRAALKNGETWNVECQICRKDGVVRWIWVCGQLYRNAQGAAMHMLGLVSDITERKQIEEKLVHNAFHDALTGLSGSVYEQLKTCS